MATGRPPFSGRFHTANEESALLARGFQYGTQPGALVIGWNSYHTAVTLPDGTNVSSGERGGVKVGGQGAYQKQFTHHMYLPVSQETSDALNGAVDAAAQPGELPPPPADVAPPPADVGPPPAEVIPADTIGDPAPPPPGDAPVMET